MLVVVMCVVALGSSSGFALLVQRPHVLPIAPHRPHHGSNEVDPR
jgi:hypothetical protein